MDSMVTRSQGVSSIEWPAISYETLPWERSPESLELVPKSRRRKIASTYEAALPAHIAEQPLVLPERMQSRIYELALKMVRFDARQRERGYDLPALLLRSESAASSQIENLTSSVRNVALAELVGKAPHNAMVIAGNVAAMRKALQVNGGLGMSEICEVHRALIETTGESFGGCLRDEQVWVGGTAYSPHGAHYVPPAAEHVADYLEDLAVFGRRTDVNPLAKAAIVHAQFETIHPFIDGNGRCGRALVHRVLRESSILAQSTLPLSAGLLHDVDAYMQSIVDYQHGDALPVINQVIAALELALVLGDMVASKIDSILDGWAQAIPDRVGSSIHALPALLAEQPVVNSDYVAAKLGITVRAANNLLAKAESLGIISRFGARERGVTYQARDLIDVLEEISSKAGIRRVMSAGF